MTQPRTLEQRIEAAARALEPRLWGGIAPTDDREVMRDRAASMAAAKRAIAAAFPEYLLEDEG